MTISSTYIERAVIVWGQIIPFSYIVVLIILLFEVGFDFTKLDFDFFAKFMVIAPIIVLPLLGFADFLILHLKFRPKN